MKTTIAGILTLVAALAVIVSTLLTGGSVDWAHIGVEVTTALGLIAGGAGLIHASDAPRRD